MCRQKKNHSSIIESRIIILLFVFLVLFIFLTLKLYWIQIQNYDNLTSESLNQRSKKVNLYPDRGIIYDMNLIPLTNNNRVDTLFVTKDYVIDNPQMKYQILELTDLNKYELEELFNSKDKILAIPLKTNINNIDDLKNMVITEKTLRYSDDNILSHVIGYINQSENRGESGIEKVFDEYLINQKNSSSLYLEVDESSGILLGENYKVSADTNSLEPSGVKLTIDYHIQKIVENILDTNRIKGSVIVADVESGEIRAMASRPNFDPDNVVGFLYRDDMALYNKAIQVGYPPGSLFKIVVLLTVLEENPSLLNHNFYCKGYEDIGSGEPINCNNTLGHGHINLEEGFSKSCNSVFIQLGKKIGSQNIIDMAKRLGFGNKINIALSEEVSGNLPEGNELQGPAYGNIAIGQGSIEVTPLQMTNLMMIIANNGLEKGLTIVDSITSQDGRIIKSYNKEEERIFSNEVCKIVKSYLKLVVKDGTAKKLDIEEIGGSAGKTGSAQGILNGEETIYGWFLGYYPNNNPKYVITVLVEDAEFGSQSALPIFEQVAKQIYNIKK